MSPTSYNGTETWHAICDVKCFWNNIRRIDKTRYSSVSSLTLAHLKLIVHRAAQFLYKSWPYVLRNWEQWTSKTIVQQRRGNTFWRDSRLRRGFWHTSGTVNFYLWRTTRRTRAIRIPVPKHWIYPIWCSTHNCWTIISPIRKIQKT